MNRYRVVGAYRLAVDLPIRHVHVLAVGTADDVAAESKPTKSWTASDLELAADSARFTIGPLGSTVPLVVGPAICSVCDERVVRVSPLEVEQRLPECLVG